MIGMWFITYLYIPKEVLCWVGTPHAFVSCSARHERRKTRSTSVHGDVIVQRGYRRVHEALIQRSSHFSYLNQSMLTVFVRSLHKLHEVNVQRRLRDQSFLMRCCWRGSYMRTRPLVTVCSFSNHDSLVFESIWICCRNFSFFEYILFCRWKEFLGYNFMCHGFKKNSKGGQF
jgi:hypothetical protein